MTNCTFVDNFGGLRENSGGPFSVILRNSIFKSSFGSSLTGNAGAIVSQGHNLSGDAAGGDGGTAPGGLLNGPGDKRNTNPQLDPAGPANNGGPTMTVALLSNSPAINMGDDALAPLTDQRGHGRNGVSDIGAFEFNGVPPAAPVPTGAVSRKLHNGTPFDVPLPLTGSSGVECRSGGAGNDYQVVVTFASAVTFTGASVTAGAGSVGSSSGGGSHHPDGEPHRSDERTNNHSLPRERERWSKRRNRQRAARGSHWRH